MKGRCMTYLLLGPRQLALQLLLLVEQCLILPTQRRKALSKLVRQPDHTLLCLIRHAGVSEKIKMAMPKSCHVSTVTRRRGSQSVVDEDLSEFRQGFDST